MATLSNTSTCTEKEYDDLPVGIVFCPSGNEIIMHYLTNKILNQQQPTHMIRDIDFYARDPHELPVSESKYCKPNEAYFFTQLENTDVKRLPTRATKNGYWMSISDEDEDEEIIWNNTITGFKKTMIFYQGKKPGGVESRWIVDEFRVNPLYLSSLTHPHALDKTIENKVETLVVCKIHYRKEESDN